MATQEVVSNPPKPTCALEDLVLARHMVHHKDLFSEEPAPVANVPTNQELNGDTATISSEETVSDTLSSQTHKVVEKVGNKEEDDNELFCVTCDKESLSKASRPSNLENVCHCNRPGSLSMPKEDEVESRPRFECGSMFASWQSLRSHLNRENPCDHDATVRRRVSALKTCHKCGRTFSSPQSLRIHLNRVKTCNQEITTPVSPSTPPTTIPHTVPLAMNTEELKNEGRIAKSRYQACRAYLKKRGRLEEIVESSSSCLQSDDVFQETKAPALKEKLHRHNSDASVWEGDSLEALNIEWKKPRFQPKVTQEKDKTVNLPSGVSQPINQPILPTSPVQNPLKKFVISEGSFVHHSTNSHGGDLLAGGCSCPPCVRRWARNIMNRMQQIEDEVVMLRQNELAEGANVNGSADVYTASTYPSISQIRSGKSNGGQSKLPCDMSFAVQSRGNSVESGHSQANAVNIVNSLASCSRVKPTLPTPENDKTGGAGNNHITFQKNGGLPYRAKGFRVDNPHFDDQQQQRPRPTATGVQGLGKDKRSLVDAYTHLNDQILMKEKIIEDSKAQGRASDSLELRKQVGELRLIVSAEKANRETTVAALIACEWTSRRDESKALLEDNASRNAPRDEQTHHTKWAEISTKMFAKDKAIAELERQVDIIVGGGRDNRARYAEMGELSSKMAAEHAAKIALESEREEVFTGLVKSSLRVRWLVRNALQ